MLFKNLLKKLLVKQTFPDVLKTEWYSKAQIKTFQEQHLRKLIHYAYNRIPYYQQLFQECNIKPHQIKTLEDLKKIPKLTRAKAIENYDRLINPNIIWNTHLSSETTGQRLKWCSSKEWQELFGQTLWRGFSWAGLSPDKRVVSFYSRVIGLIVKESFIIREAFNLNKIDQEIEQIKKFQPHFAYCYSSAAYFMARYLLEKNLRIPLEGFLVTSEQLLPHYRPVIEEAFQCKVFNNYGCNDGGAWGAECEEHSGFHQDYERAIIEFEENGRMVVTDLWNYAMPLIRYENGDAGKWLEHTCPCGRKMPLFTVTGRVNDFIVTPTQIFAPTAIAQLLKHECFSDIQVIQNTDVDIEVLFVPNPLYPLSECHEILNAFISHFENVNITTKTTDIIPKPSSNKRRICINKSNRTLDHLFNK